MKQLLTVNDLKKYLNSREFEDDAILTLFDLEDGVRHDIFKDSIDDSWLEENLFLDLNVNVK